MGSRLARYDRQSKQAATRAERHGKRTPYCGDRRANTRQSQSQVVPVSRETPDFGGILGTRLKNVASSGVGLGPENIKTVTNFLFNNVSRT